MIKKYVTLFLYALFFLGLLSSKAVFANEQRDNAAKACHNVLLSNALTQTPTGSQSVLDACAAVQACQSKVMDDVPDCALKLNTWVFTLNVPTPPASSGGGGDQSQLSTQFKAPPPALSGSHQPSLHNTPPAPEPRIPDNARKKDTDNQDTKNGINWF